MKGCVITGIFLLCMMSCTFLADQSLENHTYYLDPAAGSFEGDGSLSDPWPGLNEIISAGMIRSHYPQEHPWDKGDPLVLRNPDAPIKAGDTLRLLSGDYGSITLSEMHFLLPLTIETQPGHSATASELRIVASSNIIVAGLEIRPEPGYEEAYTLVSVSSHNWQGPSYDVTVKNCTVYSVSDISSWGLDEWNTLACSGVSAGGDRINVIDNTVLNVNFGISYTGNYGTVKGNTVRNFAGDGLRGIGNDLLFEGNTVMDNYNVNDNHDDGFQSWSLVQYDQPPRERVVLRGNTIINCTDPGRPFQGGLQGIGCFDGFFIDWIVENNLILVDHWHGITFLGARGVIVRNNTVVDTTGVTPGPSWIMIGAHKDGRPSSGCLVQNNIAHSISMDPSFGLERGNIEIGDLSELDVLFSDPYAGDFSLARESPAVNTGVLDKRAITDINGDLRPKGRGVDIGAFESY